MVAKAGLELPGETPEPADPLLDADGPGTGLGRSVLGKDGLSGLGAANDTFLPDAVEPARDRLPEDSLEKNFEAVPGSFGGLRLEPNPPEPRRDEDSPS